MDRQKLILIISAVCGLLAFVFFWQGSKKSQNKPVAVVVSKVEILQGAILTADILAFSEPLVLEDSSDFFLNMSDVVGMKTKQPIPAGKGVRRSQVQDPSMVDAGALKVAIPPGMIVVTFTSRDLENPPAFLTVGNYVDILGLAAKGAESQTVVVQSVQIVDLERNKKDESFKSLSVAMTPLEAEAASGASKLGQIRLALRLEPLIKRQQPIYIAPQAPSVKSMEVIRGASAPVRTVFGSPESFDPSTASAGGAYSGQTPSYTQSGGSSGYTSSSKPGSAPTTASQVPPDISAAVAAAEKRKK